MIRISNISSKKIQVSSLNRSLSCKYSSQAAQHAERMRRSEQVYEEEAHALKKVAGKLSHRKSQRIGTPMPLRIARSISQKSLVMLAPQITYRIDSFR